MEYLNWIEDLGAVRFPKYIDFIDYSVQLRLQIIFIMQEPILGVWSGISLGNFSDFPDWPIVPQADLQPYIDDVINEIEFITADAKANQWGQLRASLGREEPYSLTYIEM